jgi:hypothetical protein
MKLLLEWNLSIKLNDRSLLDVYFDECVCVCVCACLLGFLPYCIAI